MTRSYTRAFLAGTTILFSFQIALAQQLEQEFDDTAPQDVQGRQPTVLEQITIYGDRQGKKPLDVPANITVVDKEEIKDRAITDMKELVRDEPGIAVIRQSTGTDPFNSYGGFNIRGVGSNRVQILVDGARVPERITDGHRDYIDLNFTKQADIVRGPGSVLWGADALGGIVAVETIDPEDILRGRMMGGELDVSYSSFDNELTSSAVYAHQLAPTLSALAGFAYGRANEPELSNAQLHGGPYGGVCPRDLAAGATPCNEFDPTTKQSYRGLGKVVFEPTPDHRFEFTADILQRTTDVEYDQNLGARLSTSTGNPTGVIGINYDRSLEVSRNRFAIEHEWNVSSPLIENIKWSLSHSENSSIREGYDRRQEANGDQVLDYDFLSLDENFTELDIQITSIFNLADSKHTVTWGFDGDLATTDYERLDRLQNFTTGTTTVTRGGGFNFANADTTRADFYIQDQIELWDGVLEITPGVRLADYRLEPRVNGDYRPVAGFEPRTRSASEYLYSLSAKINVDEHVSIYGSYSEGFKMPTAQQLFTSVPGFFNLIPAPDLKPESVRSYEAGIRGKYDRGFYSVNAFYAEYTDFIQSFYFIPGTNNITHRNLSSVNLWGIEASAGFDITRDFSVDFSLSWQQGVQTASPGVQTQDYTAPPIKAVIGLTYDIPDYDLTLEAVTTLAGAVTRVTRDDGFKTPGYGLLDLYAKWQPSRNSKLRFGIKNVFDQNYYEFGAANMDTTVNNAVKATNPIELQKGAGRVFEVAYTYSF